MLSITETKKMQIVQFFPESFQSSYSLVSKVEIKNKIILLNVPNNRQHHRKTELNSFHLNGHTL